MLNFEPKTRKLNIAWSFNLIEYISDKACNEYAKYLFNFVLIQNVKE